MEWANTEYREARYQASPAGAGAELSASFSIALE
jgi:hypothetical protein